jgi:hypothetical protein
MILFGSAVFPLEEVEELEEELEDELLDELDELLEEELLELDDELLELEELELLLELDELDELDAAPIFFHNAGTTGGSQPGSDVCAWIHW